MTSRRYGLTFRLMHLVSVHDLAARVDGRTLFEHASFGLDDTDRVGVVGPNGVGKSTLLRMLAGERVPDAGEIVVRRGTHIGWLPQAPTWSDDEAGRIVAGDGVRPDEAAAILDRLGIDPAAPTNAMSEGQRRRVDLARVLVAPADLLVLDEPTNHLDVDMIDWLEHELGRRRCAVVVVTHDRYVLERAVDAMLDLEPGPSGATIHWSTGSYSHLLEARAARAAQRDARSARARNLLRKEVAWLQRRPKARGTKPRFRVEQVDQIRREATTEDERPLELGTGRRRLGRDVVTLEDVTVRRGDRVILDQVDLAIGPGERVGVVGPNGAGKTTLLEVLAGRRDVDGGTRRIGHTVHSALYEQRVRIDDPSADALDTLLAIAEHIPLADGSTLPAHRLAERFGLGEQLRTPVTELSGGEQRRLALLHVLVEAPNVVLLDEPTNDLDLETLSALEDHLDGFTGTLIVASHDRYVLDRLTDRTLALEDGRVVEHLDLDAYRQTRHDQPASRPAGHGADDSAVDNRARQQARRRQRALEQRMAELEARLGQLDHDMAEHASQPEVLAELAATRSAISTELAAAEDAWLEHAVSD